MGFSNKRERRVAGDHAGQKEEGRGEDHMYKNLLFVFIINKQGPKLEFRIGIDYWIVEFLGSFCKFTLIKLIMWQQLGW